MIDWRHEKLIKEFLGEFRTLAQNLSMRTENLFNFIIVDFSNQDVFEHIANNYGIGNFDAPGIFATYGETYYYRNYQRYEGSESFQKIGWQFVQELREGTKKPLSSRAVIDFFTVNLMNFEYYINYPLQLFIVANGFVASLLLPLLLFDTFIKPIMGRGPTMKKIDKEKNDDKKIKEE